MNLFFLMFCIPWSNMIYCSYRERVVQIHLLNRSTVFNRCIFDFLVGSIFLTKGNTKINKTLNLRGKTIINLIIYFTQTGIVKSFSLPFYCEL